MPGGMDGVELAHRAVEMRPQIKVLLTSGYAGESVDETLVHAPWPFLRKPYSQAELVDLVNAAMAAGAQPPVARKARPKKSSGKA
jgi:CheY-like chemotaxis protein